MSILDDLDPATPPGQPLREIVLAAFILGADEPLDFDMVAAGDSASWLRLWLVVDPSALGRDLDRIEAHIRSFAHYRLELAQLVTDADLGEIAAKAYLEGKPVAVRL